MNVNKYLLDTQPVIYKTFANAIKNNELSHAYLLTGANGTPLKEVAMFLSQSILCENPSPLACGECITCYRVKDGNYTDLLIFDGSLKSIKKDNILEIEKRYSKKGFEGKGVMVYVIHLIENATKEALNSLLKFLEEPQDNVYAILTCSNLNSVLPTIVSRCQIYNLKLQPRNSVIQSALNSGVTKEDAELLSYFYNDKELIDEHFKNKDDIYYLCKKHSLTVLDMLTKNNIDEFIYYFEKVIIYNFKTKEYASYFIDMLLCFFEDVLSTINSKEIYLKSYDKLLKGLADRLTNINEMIIDILKQKTLINEKINISLILIYICFIIVGETNGERSESK